MPLILSPTSNHTSLSKIFEEHEGYSVSKWSTYLDVYQQFFEKYRNTEVVVLEIGINYGGSLEIWRKFFGDKARIIGVDINDHCKTLDIDAEIHIGSQSDRKFLRELKSKIPKVDILIDDGGHTMRQQIITFEELFDHVKDDGLYACEDLHTSYWRKFGGGYKRRGTFIELSKRWIDQLNANHSKQSSLKPDYFTDSVYSMHYFDSLLVLQKKTKPENTELESGKAVPYEGYVIERSKFSDLFRSIVDRILVFLRMKDVFKR